MSEPTPSVVRHTADREKSAVALSSLLAAVLLTTLKLIVGLLTLSLGILSEAAHSFLDLLAAALTFWAVRVSGQPADRVHTYGHGKIENLSALAETLLLLVTCLWIIYESVQRLFLRGGPEFGDRAAVLWWGLGVMLVSVAVDVTRSRALRRAAVKYRSQALEADALHFSTDVWSSAVVIGGLLLVLLANALGPQWKWLEKADIFAALGVACIVVWVSVRLGQKSLNDLLDAVPETLLEEVRAAARVPGVLEVRQARVRRAGAETFADVTLAVRREAGFGESHQIATQAEEAIRRILPGADVVVHVEPAGAPHEDLRATVRNLAAAQGLAAHDISVYEHEGKRTVELHLEVEGRLTLAAAHAQATRLEQAVREAAPGVVQVVTHLEPAAEGEAEPAAPGSAAQIRKVRRVLANLKFEAGLPCEAHDIAVLCVGETLCVSFHCSLAPDTAVREAHRLTEQIEAHLRSRVPAVGRVLIHVEPPETESKK